LVQQKLAVFRHAAARQMLERFHGVSPDPHVSHTKKNKPETNRLGLVLAAAVRTSREVIL
jgi:hypothetical protein